MWGGGGDGCTCGGAGGDDFTCGGAGVMTSHVGVQER